LLQEEIQGHHPHRYRQGPQPHRHQRCKTFIQAEDHILECALLFKKLAVDANVVLLTNDVALKIKAMADGCSDI